MLVRKGLLTNEEVLEEIKAVRRELEGKRGRKVGDGERSGSGIPFEWQPLIWYIRPMETG